MYLRATHLARGDYMASHRGDPGLFGFLGKVVKTGLGIVGGLGIPGISGAARGVRSLFRPGGQPQVYGSQMFPGGGLQIPVRGVKGFLERGVPGGATGYMPRKRRRMNPGNVRALRRAMRRQDAFVKLARRALKGSKYRIATVGSGRSRPINIRESGPGGVTVNR